MCNSQSTNLLLLNPLSSQNPKKHNPASAQAEAGKPNLREAGDMTRFVQRCQCLIESSLPDASSSPPPPPGRVAPPRTKKPQRSSGLTTWLSNRKTFVGREKESWPIQADSPSRSCSNKEALLWLAPTDPTTLSQAYRLEGTHTQWYTLHLIPFIVSSTLNPITEEHLCPSYTWVF